MTYLSKPAPTRLWTSRHEAAFNWLALGMLLAAWNATDNVAEVHVRRPDSLRGYYAVSPRAVSRIEAGGIAKSRS